MCAHVNIIITIIVYTFGYRSRCLYMCICVLLYRLYAVAFYVTIRSIRLLFIAVHKMSAFSSPVRSHFTRLARTVSNVRLRAPRSFAYIQPSLGNVRNESSVEIHCDTHLVSPLYLSNVHIIRITFHRFFKYTMIINLLVRISRSLV